MKKGIVIAAVLLGSFCAVKAQTPRIVKLNELQRIMNMNNDTTYIVNFWATWCIPCVKEFPAFQALAKKHKNEKVQVVMVSLDFKKDYDKTLVPFLKKHAIDGEVILLDEPDYNSWINKVNPDWQGEIPVTFIFNNSTKRRNFFPHDFSPAELEQAFSNPISPDSVSYMTPAKPPKKGKGQ